MSQIPPRTLRLPGLSSTNRNATPASPRQYHRRQSSGAHRTACDCEWACRHQSRAGNGVPKQVFLENSSADDECGLFRAGCNADWFAFNLLDEILDLRIFKPPLVRVTPIFEAFGAQLADLSIQKIFLAPE